LYVFVGAKALTGHAKSKGHKQWRGARKNAQQLPTVFQVGNLIFIKFNNGSCNCRLYKIHGIPIKHPQPKKQTKQKQNKTKKHG